MTQAVIQKMKQYYKSKNIQLAKNFYKQCMKSE